MRDDEIQELLRGANPWWAAAARGQSPTAWKGAHPILRSRARHDLGYRSQVLDDVVHGPVDDKLVVLTGPRRVGKSVALLDAAAALCERDDVSPQQVIHLPADGMTTRDLTRALKLGRVLTKAVDREEPTRRVWLLDEVSGIDGWTTALKLQRDQTLFGEDSVVATGSRWVAHDDVTADLLAGRAGMGNHRRLRHLLPLSFRDYLAVTDPHLPRPSTAALWDLQSDAVRDVLDALTPLVDEYDLAWQQYLTSGGFPRAVYEHHVAGAVTDAYLQDLQAWLVADLADDERPDSVGLLLDGILARATSPMNVTSSARDLGYERKTLERRLARLESTFAVLECPQRRDDGRRVPGAQSKYYLTDPVLAWLPHRLRTGVAAPDYTALTEMAIGVSLAAAIEQAEQGRWTVDDTIGYLRTTSGNEVDLAPVWVPTAAGPRQTVALEAKWVSQGWKPEARTIEAKYGAGILATRSILDLSGDVWAVPAPLVALLVR